MSVVIAEEVRMQVKGMSSKLSMKGAFQAERKLYSRCEVRLS